MSDVTKNYQAILTSMATTTFAAANQTAEIALILSEQGITTYAMTVYLTPDMTVVQPSLPALHLWIEGSVELEPKLCLVQDWLIPLTCSCVYQAHDPDDAVKIANWQGQLIKQLLEKYHAASGVWGCWVKGTGTSPREIDPYLYQTDVRADVRYRTQRRY